VKLVGCICLNVGWKNVHSSGIANKEQPNLDLCLLHVVCEERWIPDLMINVFFCVCGLILWTTPMSHLSHEAREILKDYFNPIFYK
jgi:hypothetical protein